MTAEPSETLSAENKSIFCFICAAAASKVSAGLHAFKTKGGKSKRMRTSFTSEQLSRLEKEFARQQYMVGSERFLLASALQLTEAQVGTYCSWNNIPIRIIIYSRF